jgi:carboxyl-terminal processing protease
MVEIKSKWTLEKLKIKKILVVYFFVFFVAVAFGAGFLYGKFGKNNFNDVLAYYQNQSVFSEKDLPNIFQGELFKIVWGNLQESFLYQDQIDNKKMYYGALEGFVAGLGDPHTQFFDPEVTKQFEETISGEFEGIGAEIGIRDEQLTIVAPMTGSPAETAGLMAADAILAIDDLETYDMSVEAAVKMIRGPKGTVVKLLIGRENQEPKDYLITRDRIELKSVSWEFRPDGLAYVKVVGFHDDTDILFDQFINELKQRKVNGLLVDLRNNPGGLLSSANYLTSKWVDPGKIIVIEKFGDGRQVVNESKGKSELKGYKTVLLINEGSASGSEILAGALKDYQLATLIGETTFGKGSVQEMRSLPDGSSLKLTIAEWLTPLENFINEKGIDPDIAVEFTYDDYVKKVDPQLDKAVQFLLNK